MNMKIHAQIPEKLPHKFHEIKKEPAHKSPQVSFLLSGFLSLPNGTHTQRNIRLCSQILKMQRKWQGFE
jgi:hypothetical protein